MIGDCPGNMIFKLLQSHNNNGQWPAAYKALSNIQWCLIRRSSPEGISCERQAGGHPGTESRTLDA